MSASATVSMQAKDQPPLLLDIHRWMEAFLQPTVLIDVRYLGFDESGRLRQPVLRAVRTDLGIEELLAGEAAPAGDGL